MALPLKFQFFSLLLKFPALLGERQLLSLKFLDPLSLLLQFAVGDLKLGCVFIFDSTPRFRAQLIGCLLKPNLDLILDRFFLPLEFFSPCFQRIAFRF